MNTTDLVSQDVAEQVEMMLQSEFSTPLDNPQVVMAALRQASLHVLDTALEDATQLKIFFLLPHVFEDDPERWCFASLQVFVANDAENCWHLLNMKGLLKFFGKDGEFCHVVADFRDTLQHHLGMLENLLKGEPFSFPTWEADDYETVDSLMEEYVEERRRQKEVSFTLSEASEDPKSR